MAIFDFFKKRSNTLTLEQVAIMDSRKQAEAILTYSNFYDPQVYGAMYNGETDYGLLGPIYDYSADYNKLRARSWQAFYESDFAQIAVKRLLTWTIGNGLRLQAEPSSVILESEGYKMEKEARRKFVRLLEAKWDLFTESTECDWSEQLNYKQLSWEKEKNAIVGGDVLVINRIINGELKQQIVDGEHVQSPGYGSEDWPQELPSGHRIIDGVEVDRRDKQIAYWVRKAALEGEMPTNMDFVRVPAYGSGSKQRQAYLYYGSKYRIGNFRGMPLLSVCLQKAKEIDEYSKATLNQAKNTAKIAYQNVVDKEAEANSAWAKGAVSAIDVNRNKLPVTTDGLQVNKVAKIATIGEVFSNAPGNKVEVIENKNPLYFKDYFELNRDSLFSALEIPPNVAMQMYNESFSASRAAIMDWAHTLSVKRENHRVGTIKYDYELWFYLEVMTGRISAPGYFINKNIRKAYHKARFTGANVPHIDPLKEANAARVKLGKAFDNVPLDDLESITESLGGGNSYENLEQAGEELKTWVELEQESGYKSEAEKKQAMKPEKEDGDD